MTIQVIAKRARFSLRSMILATAICAALLFVCVVRPTMLANRLVAAVDRSDFSAVDELLGGKSWRDWTARDDIPPAVTRADHIYVELFPRDLWDWLDCRRRIVVRIARHWDSNDQHAEWTEDIDLVSSATGVSISPPDADF